MAPPDGLSRRPRPATSPDGPVDGPIRSPATSADGPVRSCPAPGPGSGALGGSFARAHRMCSAASAWFRGFC